MIYLILGIYAFQILMAFFMLLTPEGIYSSKSSFYRSLIPFYWLWKILEHGINTFRKLEP